MKTTMRSVITTLTASLALAITTWLAPADRDAQPQQPAQLGRRWHAEASGRHLSVGLHAAALAEHLHRAQRRDRALEGHLAGRHLDADRARELGGRVVDARHARPARRPAGVHGPQPAGRLGVVLPHPHPRRQQRGGGDAAPLRGDAEDQRHRRVPHAAAHPGGQRVQRRHRRAGGGGPAERAVRHPDRQLHGPQDRHRRPGSRLRRHLRPDPGRHHHAAGHHAHRGLHGQHGRLLREPDPADRQHRGGLRPDVGQHRRHLRVGGRLQRHLHLPRRAAGQPAVRQLPEPRHVAAGGDRRARVAPAGTSSAR